MNFIQMVDDDGQTVPYDLSTQISQEIRSQHYKHKSVSDLSNLNWKLNKIQTDWGNYSARMAEDRTTTDAANALLNFRADIESLQASWMKVQEYKLAGRILFTDAIAKNGHDEILFNFDLAITSPELQAIVSGLTPNQLRRRMPSASGPLPIKPLVPDLVLLLRQLEASLEPMPYVKSLSQVASHKACCEIASRLLKIIHIDFSAHAIRNATRKLP